MPISMLMLSRCLINKISALELSREFIKGALLVGEGEDRERKSKWHFAALTDRKSCPWRV